jgi:acetyl-CoA carboxylase biotin carboxylase subunit
MAGRHRSSGTPTGGAASAFVNKILIANRGEIAVRLMRACRDLGVRSVAVYSDADRASPHVRYADEAHHIGPNAPSESYLRIERLIDVARRAGADAVHPGYGFLAENETFAAACRDAGLVFIGPSPEAIALMGNKTAARDAARRAGVPVVPGTPEPVDPQIGEAALRTIAADIGFPLLVKAVAGGGGKGMRTVERAEDLMAAVRAAGSEAGSAFGDAAVYFERKLIRPRHIEVQLLGDHHGTVVPFVERECSIQRRHQKVIEESPSVAVTPAQRHAIAEAAARVAREVGYTNAGTIETLQDEDGGFYFLEMNTRLQVEHPVTELVTGLDLVHWQIRIARGERLTIDPERALQPRGHAIECRIYAEDPDNNFMPSPGIIQYLHAPSGPGIRRDSGVQTGFEVPIFYDSMISKLCAWGEDRSQAIARMRRALSEYEVRGIKTTIPFFQWMLTTRDFLEGRFHTTTLDALLGSRAGRPFVEAPSATEEVAAIAAAVRAYLDAHTPSSAGEGRPPAPSAWRLAARREALRTDC